MNHTTHKYELTLDQLIGQSNVTQAARQLGVTKGAVQQMVKNQRDIYCKKIGGKWHYSELRGWRRGES